jgi:SAM-dependent methyltransferase
MATLLSTLKRNKYALKVKNWGLARYCPVCKSHLRKLKTFGLKKRPNARCPVCDMLERHRAIWLFLKNKTNLMNGQPKKMMHVAPEVTFEKLFRKVKGIDYLSVDLYSPRAMEKVDITDIPYDDSTFDMIYCSHVLEHVPDDRKALSEFFRVLKPGGWALICIPMQDKETFEDPSVTDPKERERLFGQNDHVRKYGPDAIERVKDAGFKVETITPDSFVGPKDIQKFAIAEAGTFFFCQK